LAEQISNEIPSEPLAELVQCPQATLVHERLEFDLETLKVLDIVLPITAVGYHHPRTVEADIGPQHGMIIDSILGDQGRGGTTIRALYASGLVVLRRIRSRTRTSHARLLLRLICI